MKHLRHYFNRLSPKSGIIWTKVHIILDQDPKDITSGPSTQLGWWYRDNDEGLYLRPLWDAESTQDLGILAYTCNFTNVAHTMDLINKAMAELGCKFKIGGKLRPIKSFNINDKIRATHRENGGLWQTQYWFALHLISDVSHQRTAIRYLYRLFNQKNATQPGGLRARFIPNEGIITMSSTALGKRFKMLKKHKAVICFSGRRLQLSHPDSVRRYLEHLVPVTENLQLLARARALNRSIQHTITPSQQTELETIDKLRTTAMLVGPHLHPVPVFRRSCSGMDESSLSKPLSIIPTCHNPGRHCAPHIHLRYNHIHGAGASFPQHVAFPYHSTRIPHSPSPPPTFPRHPVVPRRLTSGLPVACPTSTPPLYSHHPSLQPPGRHGQGSV